MNAMKQPPDTTQKVATYHTVAESWEMVFLCTWRYVSKGVFWWGHFNKQFTSRRSLVMGPLKQPNIFTWLCSCNAQNPAFLASAQHILSYRLTISFFLSILLPLSTTCSLRFTPENQKVPLAFNQCLHGSLKKEQWDKLSLPIPFLQLFISSRYFLTFLYSFKFIYTLSYCLCIIVMFFEYL